MAQDGNYLGLCPVISLEYCYFREELTSRMTITIATHILFLDHRIYQIIKCTEIPNLSRFPTSLMVLN